MCRRQFSHGTISITEMTRSKSELINLRSLANAEPATGTGRVAWIWPEIETALGTGKKLREVWEAVRADGLDIPYPQFRVYVSRIRMRRARRQLAHMPIHAASGKPTQPEPQAPTPKDPFSNLREQREKKQSDGFTYDPFSIQKELID